jgi:hypothetical protein
MPISLSGSLNLSGSLTTTGTITATTLVVQTITSSISSITGSTNFGSLSSNTHKFTGSLNITGSLSVVTTGTEFQVTSTGVNLGNALTDSHVISGSLRVNPNGLFVSSSGNVGIGLTTPKESLEVAGLYGNIRIYGRTGVSNNAITSNTYYDGTNWVRDNSSYGAAQIILSAQLGSIIFGTTGSAVGDATERMRITSTGNVGIGTSTPVSLLNIHSGDFTIQKNAIGNSTEVGNINFRNDYMGAYTWAQIKGVNGANHDFSNITFSTTNGFNSLSEKARITPEGYLRLAGAGIQFNGDTADANSLDDYEEGTWTPTLIGNASSPSYTSQFGKYTKIGRLVHLVGKVGLTNGSGGGIISIGGLPFSTADGTDAGQRCSARVEGDFSGFGNAANVAALMFRANGTEFTGVYVYSSGASAYATYNLYAGTFYFNFSVTYYT